MISAVQQKHVLLTGLKWSPVGSLCVKRIALGQPPAALCLHLRRAYWTNSGHHIKLSGHVRFPLTLDIGQYSAATLEPLSSLSQQYVPTASQAAWVRSSSCSAQTVYGTASLKGGTGDAETVTSSATTTGDAGDGTEAEMRSEAGVQNTSSTSDEAASDSGHSAEVNKDAASKDRVVTVPQHKGLPTGSPATFSVSAFANSNAPAASQGNESLYSGQTGAAGPVKRLLASHALSLASSLTSDSSLLSGDMLDEVAANMQSPQGLTETADARVADTDATGTQGVDIETMSRQSGYTEAAGPSMTDRHAEHATARKTRMGQGSSGAVQGRAEQGLAAEQYSLAARQSKPAGGAMQRVLASHALSLACSLMSEMSIRDEDVFQQDASAMTDESGRATSATGASTSAAEQGTRPATRMSVADSSSAEADATHPDATQTGAGSSAGPDLANRPEHTGPTSEEPSHSTSPCPTEAVRDGEASDGCLSVSQLSTCKPLSRKRQPYNLTAAVVHHGGGSSSGHYTVYRRVRLETDMPEKGAISSARDIWFSISDETVHKVEVSDVLACEATLLMYES